MKRILFSIICLSIFLAAGTAQGEIVTRTVQYEQDGTALESYLAYDDSITGKRPGVVVVHEWYGLNDYAKRRAREIASLGYVALAADIYGKGVRAKDSAEAAALSGKFKNNPALLRARAQAAVDVLARHELVDKDKLAAIGYCFGGTTVLELARSGSPIKGVVSFHGGLATFNPAGAGGIKAAVLVLHGADDPYVKPQEVAAFQDEMRTAGADWQMVYYAGAVHSFTNPASGNDPTRGVAYNEKAAFRSWEAMRLFLKEIFR